MLTLLAFSDLHHSTAHAVALVKASANADLVVAAGDFCNRRAGLGAALALLSGIRTPILAVPGNAESAEELLAAAPPNMTVLHGTSSEVSGIHVFGLGYAVPQTPFGDWSCDLSEAQATQYLDRCARADLLIVHSPPKGVADRTSQGLSIGSTAIRAAVERLQPKLVLCGHVHDSWGERGQIGESQVANLGPTPNMFIV